MTLIGKIFTVLIFVMSLVFMSFAVAVYSTHQNWRAIVLRTADQTPAGEKIGLQHRLERLGTENQDLLAQREKIEIELKSEKKATEEAIGKLETKYTTLSTEHELLVEQNAAEVEERRKAVAAVTAAESRLTKKSKEADGLRSDVEKARKDRDAHFKEVTRLYNELHQRANERKLLKARQLTLAEDLQKAKELLRRLGYKIGDDPSGIPPPVDGVVLAVPESNLVEISLGSDDGLMKGHKLEVYRITGGTTTYVGRIHVIETSYDKAACKVDPNPLFRKSAIQRGDYVTSKILR